MTDASPPKKKLFRWRIRRPLLGCGAFVVILLLLVGWLGIRYVAGASFRGQAGEMIEATLGVEATLGAVRLQLFPSPGLTVYDVALSLADARFRVEHLSLEAALGVLVSGQFRPDRIRARGVTLELPVARGDVASFLTNMRSKLNLENLRDRPAAGSVSWPSLAIDDLRVVGADGLWLAGELGAAEGKDGYIEWTGWTQAPILGEEAAVQFAMAIQREESALSGEVDASGISADQLGWVKAMAPGLMLSGRIVLGGTLEEGIQGALEGTSQSADSRFNGAFEGDAWLMQDQVVLNDISWQVSAGSTIADATYVVGEGWQIQLEELGGNRDLIAALLGYFEGGPYALVPGDEAALHGLGIAMVAPNEAPFAFISGVFHADDLGFFEGEKVILDKLAVEGSIHEGIFKLDKVSHPQGRASGQLSIDYESTDVAVDWSGEIDLSTGIAGALWSWLPPHEATGAAVIEAARFAWTPEAGFAVEELLCSGTGLEALIHPAGWDAPAALRNAHARLEYGSDTLKIEHFEAESVSMRGEVVFEEGSFLLDLVGDIDLGSGLAALFLPESIRDPRGQLRLAEARGRFHVEEGLESDFQIEAMLEDGAARLQLNGRDFTVEDLQGTVASAEKGLELQLAMTIDLAGPIRFSGHYGRDFVEGTLEGAPGRLAAGFLSESLRPWIGALAGNSTERIEVAWHIDQRLSLRIAEGGALDGALEMAQAGNEWQLETLSLKGNASAEEILIVADLGARGEGPVAYSFLQDENDHFQGALNFTEATIGAGALIEKRVGDRLTVEVSGALKGEGYELQTLKVDALGQEIAARWDGIALTVPSLQIDLAKLGPIFPQDAKVGGRISGSVDLGRGQASLMLDSLQLEREDLVSISRLHGPVSYQQGHWLCENLEVQGEGNDFSLRAEIEGNVWQGAVGGTSLDLEGLMTLRNGIEGLFPQGAGKDGVGPALVGRFDVALDSVRYHRGVIEDVAGTAHLSPSSLRMDPFRCKAYEGTAQGALSWEYEGLAGVELALEKVDLRILDDLLFEEPRDVSGPLSGQVSVSFLPVSDVHPLATMNGSIHYTAEGGTYGRMGNATRLLTLLKTTELIRLSLPSLRDDGLTFQESSGEFVFENGLATINSFMLRDQAYAMAGEGSVDFARDTTDLQLHVHLLESVSGIVGSVPILRSTVQRFRETAGIRVVVSGSPFSPQFEADRAVKPLRALGTLLTAPFRGSNGDAEEE